MGSYHTDTDSKIGVDYISVDPGRYAIGGPAHIHHISVVPARDVDSMVFTGDRRSNLFMNFRLSHGSVGTKGKNDTYGFFLDSGPF